MVFSDCDVTYWQSLDGLSGVGVVMDVAVVSGAVAGMLAAGGVKELGEAAGGGLVAGIIDRVKKVFGSDVRSADALEQTRLGEPGAVAELASALAWYARRDQAFAEELAAWAAQAGNTGGVTQQIRADRDAYVAGRDQTVTNYRQRDELNQHSEVPGGKGSRDARVRQETAAERDAYTIGGNQLVVHFPAAGQPQPGVPRRVWGDVPARNLGFTGRTELLAAVRAALVSGDRAVVQALRGMGGVGKTQLAIEYAHRHAPEYDIVWWIAAERPELIAGQFTVLSVMLGCTQLGADDATVRRAVLGELRQRDRWLLVFDNAENPGDITRWLPGGPGHVLITSRAQGWDELAVPVEVDVMARGESVALLRRRVQGLGEAGAGLVAEVLGDLPLALAQAAAYMAPAGIGAADYVRLVEEQAAEILDAGRPPSYALSLAAVTQLALERLEAAAPAAAQAVRVCAFMAPEPVPASWFTRAAGRLPEPLNAAAADPLVWGQVLARISGQALARTGRRGLLIHRLTQALLRDQLTPEQAAVSRDCAEAILAASNPEDPGNPITWPQWAQLMPHLLAADLAHTSSPALRWTAGHACWYLLARGDSRTALHLATHLRQNWRERLGGDDKHVWASSLYRAWALQELGRYAEARELDEETLEGRRRVLGDDHHDTLATANNLAIDLKRLGEYQAARELDEDTLARRRRILGDDHPLTLSSATNLAEDLSGLGEHQAARELDEDTLARYRRMFGADHPYTLASASNLAIDLRNLGEYEAARNLDQDTLARRRRVLGEDHPHTLGSASSLAAALRALGEHQAARDLDQDTLARRRRVLGEDHPDTLTSAINLAAALRALGESREGSGT